MINTLLFFSTVIGFLIIFFTFWFIKKHREKVKLRLSLTYNLLLIELPKPSATQSQQEPKIKIRLFLKLLYLTTESKFISTLPALKKILIF
jgi:hypothetical protein